MQIRLVPACLRRLGCFSALLGNVLLSVASATPTYVAWDAPTTLTDGTTTYAPSMQKEYRFYKKLGAGTYDVGSIVALSSCATPPAAAAVCPGTSVDISPAVGSATFKISAVRIDPNNPAGAGIEGPTSTELRVHSVVVARAGTGTGTVSGDGISCGTTCDKFYAEGRTITLVASPNAGSVFQSWSGAPCAGQGASCSIPSISGPVSVTANFTPSSPTTYTLSVSKTGTGTGTITGTLAAATVINCGADCSETAASGSVISLSVAPSANSDFTGWSGACSGTGACTVTLDAAKTVTANFNLKSYTLSVSKAGTGAGTVTGLLGATTVINCGADCGETATAGSVISLTAVPNADANFTGWSGACSGTGACSVTLDAAKSVTATFTLKTYTLSVAKAGTGTGTVTGMLGASTVVNCGADCSETANSGSVITLSAVASADSNFSGWSGACSGAGACSVTLDAAKSVTATFVLKTYTLTVTKAGTGTGTVTGLLGATTVVNCGADCSETANSGSLISLTAAASANSDFTGWTGACSGTGACSVTLDAAKSVGATFTLKTFALTVTKAGTGVGTVTGLLGASTVINCGADCNETAPSGSVVSLSAVADVNSTFTGWSGGGCSGTGACSVTVDAAKTVTATFTLKPFSLGVTKAGTGSGTVTGLSGATTVINCGSDCSETVAPGTVINLSAVAAADSTFSGWSGAGCTGTGACSVTVDAAKSVTATFTLKTYTLTVTKAGTGTGTVTGLLGATTVVNCGADCSETANSGSIITLSATPNADSNFTGWSGACTGTGACSVTVDAAKTVTAMFTLKTFALTVTKSGTGTGTVSGTLGATTVISCGADCSETANAGSLISLSATPAADSTFTGWSGACTGTGACSVTLDAAKTVTATFALKTFTLTVTKAGTGSGSVAGMLGATSVINCGADCSETANIGSVITLSATPSANATFTGWSGACSGSGACSVTLDAAKTVTATFTLKTYQLSVTKVGNGTVTAQSGATTLFSCGATCSSSVADGASVTLTATPGAGLAFAGWSGVTCPSSSTTCTFTMSAATTVQATFASTIYLGFEAEQANLVAPMNAASDANAVGKSAISSATANTGTATFTIPVSVAGSYVVWARVIAPSVNNDAFFVSMDGSEDTFDAAQGTQGSSWQWSRVNGRNGTANPLTLNPRSFVLSPGNHTLVFRARDINVKLDTIIVTNDLSFVPGAQGSATVSVTAQTTGDGSITGPGLSCPGDCTEGVTRGSVLALSAVPGNGALFTAWTAGCPANDSTCNILVLGDTSVAASFRSATISSPNAPSGFSVDTGGFKAE